MPESFWSSQLLGLRDGGTVGSRVGGGGIHLGFCVVHDGVAAAHAGAVGLGDGDLMPFRR